MTKGREIFIKSQPPFDVHRQYLDVSLIDLQDRVSRFRCRLMIFLHLESFENKLFELDFSIFKKACFYGQTPLER